MITPGNKIMRAICLLLTALKLQEIPVRKITGRLDTERVIFFLSKYWRGCLELQTKREI